MGPGARWGSISTLAPSQPRRDQAGWVLPSGWRSPRIWPFPAVTRTRRVDVVRQTFPITNRLSRDQSRFCSLGSVFSRLPQLTFMDHGWVRLMPPPVLSWFLPPSDGVVHRHPRSPTDDAARRPAFVPPPPRLASSHSFLRVHTIAAHTAVSRCPVRRLPTCIANSPPATVVTSGLLPY
jgi:hypothetical protein